MLFAIAKELEHALWNGPWAGVEPPSVPRDGELHLMLSSHEKLDALRVPHETSMRFWYGASPPGEDLGPCLIALQRNNEDSHRLAFEAYTRCAGIFLWTRSPIDEVRRSLLRFAIGIFPDGATRLLPFYDPAVVEGFLETAPAAWLDELFRTIAAIYRPRPSDDNLVFTQWDQETLRSTQWHLPSQMSLSTPMRRSTDAEPLPPEPEPQVRPTPSHTPPTPSRILVVRDDQFQALASAQVRRKVGVPPGQSTSTIGVALDQALATRVEQAAHQKLVDALTENLHEHHPKLASFHPVPDLERMIETSLRRASSHGLTQPKALFEFAKLMFLVAPNFDEHSVMRSHLSKQTVAPEERLSRGIQAMSTRDWQRAQRDFDAAAWELPPLR